MTTVLTEGTLACQESVVTMKDLVFCSFLGVISLILLLSGTIMQVLQGPVICEATYALLGGLHPRSFLV